MKPDKAYTMECPFVQRKCKAVKCMAWMAEDENGVCAVLRYYGLGGDSFIKSEPIAIIKPEPHLSEPKANMS